MQWTSYLPSSPESLTRIEWWLWFFAGLSIIFSVLLSFGARGVSQHKAHILQNQLDAKTKQLQSIAEEAKQKVIEAEAKNTPRRLSIEQKKIIVQKLNNFKGAKISIQTFLGDNETFDYGQDFISSFKAAGWNVIVITTEVMGRTPVGIKLIIKDYNNPPIGAIALIDLLKQIGIQVSYFHNSGMPPDMIQFDIGIR